jgi:hypothetical protein
MDLEGFKRTGRRTGDVAPIQVVETVVAGAPNLVEVVAILNSAAQMRADRGKGSIFTLGSHEQESRATTKSENLGAVRFQVSNLGCNYFITTKVRHRRRNQVSKHGIDESDDRT